MESIGDNWLNIIQKWFFAPRCLLCGNPGQRAPLLDLCAACQRDLPLDSHADLRLMPSAQHVIDDLIAPYRYGYPLDRLITALKYRDAVYVARVLGSLLANEITNRAFGDIGLGPGPAHASAWPDVLLPVPLHNNRLRSRGFNQAYEIARPISRCLGIPVDAGLCRRVLDTPSQTGLGAAERKRNHRNAFDVRENGMPISIAIIDDVITTGSTATAIATELKKCGAKKVQVWCVARAH